MFVQRSTFGLQRKQAFVLDALQLFMRDHPFAAAPAAALTFFGPDSAASAPFADSELSATENLGDFGGCVVFLGWLLLNQCSKQRFDALQAEGDFLF